jgi:hypothetical protein
MLKFSQEIEPVFFQTVAGSVGISFDDGLTLYNHMGRYMSVTTAWTEQRDGEFVDLTEACLQTVIRDWDNLPSQGQSDTATIRLLLQGFKRFPEVEAVVTELSSAGLLPEDELDPEEPEFLFAAPPALFDVIRAVLARQNDDVQIYSPPDHEILHIVVAPDLELNVSPKGEVTSSFLFCSGDDFTQTEALKWADNLARYAFVRRTIETIAQTWGAAQAA